MRSMFKGRFYGALVAVLLLTAALVPALSPEAAEAQSNSPLRSYADVVEVAAPTVVNIAAEKVVDMRSQHPFMEDPMFRRFFGDPDQQGERTNNSLGSGVLISSDGYILTNNHVVQDARDIRVTLEGDREYEAEIIGTDPRTDVALIKIDVKNIPSIVVANSDELRVGDQVMAIGNPFGVGQTVTMGIVSALGRSIGLIDYEDLIQTDAAINPGNSGGALVNMRGELVGMNSALLSRDGGSQGIGFAIPTNMASRIVEALKKDGEVKRAYLGVVPQPVDQSVADYYGLEKPHGALVVTVNDDTPASKAGIKDGDIILEVDGREIKNPSMLRNVISLSDVDHKAKIVILRDGKEKTMKVKLAAFPGQVGNTPPSVPEVIEDETLEGVTVREISDSMRAMQQIPEDMDGLLVTAVVATSSASRVGLAEGDIILQVDKRDVSDLDEYRDALERSPDKPAFLRVYKSQQQRSVYIAVPR
jgi:serine protease Do